MSFGNLCNNSPITSFLVFFLQSIWFKIKWRYLIKEQKIYSRTDIRKWFDERRVRAQRNWDGGRGEKGRTALDVTFQTGWKILPFTLIPQLCNYQLFQLWKRLIRFYISGVYKYILVLFFKQRLCCLLLIYLKSGVRREADVLVFKTESHKKACKDFALADIQEGNSNISAGNNIQNLGNT